MKNESWFPLGIPWKQERFLLWTGLLLSAGAGLVLFLCQYLPARRALYGYDGTVSPDGAMVRVLLPGTLVPPLFPPALWAAALFSGAGPLPGRGGRLPLSLSLSGRPEHLPDAASAPVRRAVAALPVRPRPGPAAGRGTDGRRHPAVRAVLLPPDTCGPPAPGALGRPAAGLDWRQPCLK